MVANTTAMLRTALDRVLGDLKRHYATYLNAVGPEALDPEGNPIRAPGAYSSAEATAKDKAILRDAQQFLPPEEIQAWQQRFTIDLDEALAVGGEAAAALQTIVAGAGAQFTGANPLAIRAATQAATAFMEGEDARFRDQIAQIVSEGIALGWGSKKLEPQIVRALEGTTDPQDKTARIGLRRRAEKIVRSELANAYANGAIDHNLNEGFAYIRWIAATDEGTCLCCLSRHGRIYPADLVAFPAHAECRCTLVPLPASEVQEEDPVIRDTLLDGEFWREAHDRGIKALAKREGISEKKARSLLQQAISSPTPSERHLFPDRKISLPPSVPLDAPKDGRTFSEAIAELAARRAAARGDRVISSPTPPPIVEVLSDDTLCGLASAGVCPA
jgi:SPP1 gp7 family putative phage head morphogenesis protein